MSPAALQRVVFFVAVLTMLSFAVPLATLTWRLTGQDDGRTRVVVPMSIADRPTMGGDLNALLRAAPFGASASLLTASANTTGLSLRGIVLAAPRSSSTALISAPGGPVTSVATGETAPGGAVVELIEMDRVILNVNGERQVLSFHDATAPAPAAPSVPAPGAPFGAPAPVAAPATPGPASASQTPPSGGVASPPSVVEQYRQRLNQNPRAAVQALGAEPTASGYRVGPTPSPELIRAGLQPGDLIESVNGVRVGEGQSDRALFDSAVVAGNARVEVVRDGRRMVLSFPLR